MGTKGLMMEGLAVMTDRAGLDIIGDEGDYAGPIELMTMFLIVLVMPGCPARQWS